MLTIGIDPDLHDLAVAAWLDGQPSEAHVIRVPKRKGVVGARAALEMVEQLSEDLSVFIPLGASRVAVEAQTLQRAGTRQHKRPQDIVTLGQVAGAALALCFASLNRDSLKLFPTPEQWKGQIPKDVMQARLYDRLGWGYEMRAGYAVPKRIPNDFEHISIGQWKHVGDAILLAEWASRQG